MFSAVLPSSDVIPWSAQCGSWKSEPDATHEMAKLLLRRAGTLLQRYDAMKTVDRLGMPLGEIEAYLDELDLDGLDVARNQSQN